MSYDEKCLKNIFVSISDLVVLNSITYIKYFTVNFIHTCLVIKNSSI